MRISLVLVGLGFVLLGLLFALPNLLSGCVGAPATGPWTGPTACSQTLAWGYTGLAVLVVGVFTLGVGWLAAPASASRAEATGARDITCLGCGRNYPEGLHAFCQSCGRKLGSP